MGVRPTNCVLVRRPDTHSFSCRATSFRYRPTALPPYRPTALPPYRLPVRASLPPPCIGQRDDLPPLRILRELERIDAAVAELAAEVEVVLHPDRREIPVDPHLGLVDPFVPHRVARL